MLRLQEGVMAMSWSDLWELFTPHGCRVWGPVKFAGSLHFLGGSVASNSWEKPQISLRVHYFFQVGPTLQNPEKTAGKSEFWKFLDEPILWNPEKPQENCISRFFLVPKKLWDTAGKSRFWALFIAGKNARNFWTSPSFNIPRHYGKIRVLRFFWVP